MSKAPQNCAVLVRCFNEEAHIGRLLTGIRSQTMQPDEILLVDSGSTDATLAIASAFDVSIVSIASSDFSFGRALNVGMRELDADLVVLASAHVYPRFDNWLELLLEPLGDPEIALVYGRQVAPPSSPYSERRVLSQWFPPSSHAKVRTPFCNNANAAIRREVWLDQPYDEDLTGLEDLAWGKEAVRRGYFLSYAAEAEIVHVHEESFGEIANRYRREAIAHKRIFPKQAMGVAESARLCAANVARDLARATADGELPRHAVDILRFRVAQFWGTRQGFSQSGPVEKSLLRRFYYPARRQEVDDAKRPAGRLIDYGENPPHD